MLEVVGRWVESCNLIDQRSNETSEDFDRWWLDLWWATDKEGKMKVIGEECSCLQKRRNDAMDLDVTKICENAYLIMHKICKFGFHNTLNAHLNLRTRNGASLKWNSSHKIFHGRLVRTHITALAWKSKGRLCLALCSSFYLFLIFFICYKCLFPFFSSPTWNRNMEKYAYKCLFPFFSSPTWNRNMEKYVNWPERAEVKKGLEKMEGWRVG
jgi:hypothetical protein